MKLKLFTTFRLIFLTIGVILTTPASAYFVNGGTYEIKEGESVHLEIERSSYFTVTGNWSKQGNSAYISSKSNRSCTVTGINPGTTYIKWVGIVGTTDSEWNWTIVVKNDPNKKKDPDKLEDGDTFTYSYDNTDVLYQVLSANAKTCQVGAGVEYKTGDYNYVVGERAVSTSLVRNSLSLPETANGYKVVGISQHAFDGCTNIKHVSIPQTVKKIGKFAFCASGINTVSIPGSVETIEVGAFQNCTSLTSISIPDAVKEIDGSVFQIVVV